MQFSCNWSILLDISGNISINKKKFGNYNPQGSFKGLHFSNKKPLGQKNPNSNSYEHLTGLNDLDLNILSTKGIPIGQLRLEIQLNNTEKKLGKINEAITNDKKLNYVGFESNKKLYLTKKRLEKEVNIYRKQYREQGFPYKVIDTLNQAKSIAFEGIALINDTLKNHFIIKKSVDVIPFFRGKQQLQAAQLLNKKLTNEIAKPTKKDTKELENLLHRANKLTL